jgi:prephenate dehydrogenase
VVFLAIPLESYETVLVQIRPFLKPETLLVDVASVKVKPAEMLNRFLPDHENMLFTHPLFGPQSYGDGRRHTLVVTKADTHRGQQIVQYCENKLKLEVLVMSNEDHDKRMAEIHVLTFYIARGLSLLGLHSEPFMTPSFQSLLDLVALDKSHTEALFETIQKGNPFAAIERQTFVSKLQEIEQELATSASAKHIVEHGSDNEGAERSQTT